MVNKDLYETLGVAEDATQEEIKAAYKRLAKKYHPDVAEMDREEAEDRFKEVSRAYAVLSDKKKRKDYDQDRRFGGFDIPKGPMYVWEYQPYMDSYTWFPKIKKEWNEHHDVIYG